MVLCRLYSGLAESLASGTWSPSGVPAIYQMLEKLAGRGDLEVRYVFAARDPDLRFRRTVRRRIHPLGEVLVLPWRDFGALEAFGVGRLLREAEQIARAFWHTLTFRPDAIYATNGVILLAGLLARLRVAPVTMRFLGIFQIQRELAAGGGSSFARWLYRAPFARAICTLDGSGAKHHLPRLLRPGTALEVLLNGVTRIAPSQDRSAIRSELGLSDKTLVLFVGRLEIYKGGREFIEAIIETERLVPASVQSVVVGGGPLLPELRARIEGAGMADRVHFAGAVPHDAVATYLSAADIYVSLNRFGNLSNANLEAFAAGRCTLILEPDPEHHIDLETSELVPENAALRVPRTDTVHALALELARLVRDPQEIERRGRAAGQFAARHLTDWNSRIEREMEMLLGGGPESAATMQEGSAV